MGVAGVWGFMGVDSLEVTVFSLKRKCVGRCFRY